MRKSNLALKFERVRKKLRKAEEAILVCNTKLREACNPEKITIKKTLEELEKAMDEFHRLNIISYNIISKIAGLGKEAANENR